MVSIACRVPNGIMLKLYKDGFDDGTGVKQKVQDGAGVRLNGPSALHTGAGHTAGDGIDPALTEVDAAWWDCWLAQNRESAMVSTKQVYRVEREESEASQTLRPTPPT